MVSLYALPSRGSLASQGSYMVCQVTAVLVVVILPLAACCCRKAEMAAFGNIGPVTVNGDCDAKRGENILYLYGDLHSFA